MVFDERLEKAVESIVGSRLDGPHKTILRLPVAKGGVGLREHAGNESIHAFNSRISLISPFLRTHFAPVVISLDVQGKEPFLPLPDVVADAPVTSLLEVHQYHFDKVLATLAVEDELKLAFVRSGSIGATDAWTASGSWLLWSGGLDGRRRFQDDAFRTSLRQRLVLPDHNAALPCPNENLHHNGPVDLLHSFMHTVRCQPTAGVSKALKWRHDTVVRALSDLLRDVAFANQPVPPQELLGKEVVVGEVAGVGDAPATQLVADLVYRHNMQHANAHRYVFDVSIVEPTNRHGAGEPRGSAADEAARSKTAKYATILAMVGTTFVPFVLESNGYVGQQAAEFLTDFAARWPRSNSRIHAFLNEVSFAMAKGTGWAGAAGRLRAYHARYQQAQAGAV